MVQIMHNDFPENKKIEQDILSGFERHKQSTIVNDHNRSQIPLIGNNGSVIGRVLLSFNPDIVRIYKQPETNYQEAFYGNGK